MYSFTKTFVDHICVFHKHNSLYCKPRRQVSAPERNERCDIQLKQCLRRRLISFCRKHFICNQSGLLHRRFYFPFYKIKRRSVRRGSRLCTCRHLLQVECLLTVCDLATAFFFFFLSHTLLSNRRSHLNIGLRSISDDSQVSTIYYFRGATAQMWPMPNL